MPRRARSWALGRVAHDSVIGRSREALEAAFGHGAVHTAGKLMLFGSYHCSRYNTIRGD